MRMRLRMAYSCPGSPFESVTSARASNSSPSTNCTHRALVLHHKQHAVRLALGELLQDVDKVDGREKVAPRIVGHELDLVALGAAPTGRRGPVRSAAAAAGRVVRADGRGARARRWMREERVFGSRRVGARVAVGVAEAEEAARKRRSERIPMTGPTRTHLCSGRSCLMRTRVDTSCMPNILRMRSRQFESTRSCEK